MQDNQIGQIIDRLPLQERMTYCQIIMKLMTAKNDQEAEQVRQSLGYLSPSLQQAIADTVMLKLEDAMMQLSVASKKRQGAEIRKTAEELLKTMIQKEWDAGDSRSDIAFVDRAIAMAQRLHDAT